MIVRLKNFCKSEKFVKSLKNMAVVFAYVIIAVALMSNFGFADEATSAASSSPSSVIAEADINSETGLEKTMKEGFNKIQRLMLGFSIPAVVIAVGTGVFIKKFSMGKQDKIELGNKLIRDSIIGFIVMNAMPTVARTIYDWMQKENKENMQSAKTSIEYFKNFF